MAEEPLQDVSQETGPSTDIQTPAQYPTASRIENGVAYDISGKALGSISDADQTSAPQKPKFDPNASIQAVPSEKPKFDPNAPIQAAQTVASPEQPGFLKRLGQSVGAPTSEEDLRAFAEANKPSVSNIIKDVLGPAPDAISGMWDYAKRVARNVRSDVREVYEAGRNIAEGGPVGANIGKAAYAYAHGAVADLPFVGEPAETLAQDIESKNYLGAAGSAAGIVAQVALPEASERLMAARNAHANALTSAVREHMASDAIHKTAVGEVDTATAQVVEARHRADMAIQNETAGQGSRQQTVDAQNNLSEASANLKRTQAAVNEAAVSKAEAAVKVSQATRDVETAAKPKIKAPKVATPEEISKAKQDFQTAIPSGPGKAAYSDEDYAAVRPYLEVHHAAESPVNTPEAVYDAMDVRQKKIEQQIKPWTEKYANEPLKLTDEAGEPVSVKQKLVEALKEQEAVRPGFTEDALKVADEFNLTDPSVAEADRIRKALNTDNRKKLAESHWNISDAIESDPDFAARYNLADILRDGLYDRFEDKGVLKAREMRQQERSVISVRNAADRMIPKADVKARGTSEAGPVRKLIGEKAATVGAGIGAAGGVSTGIPGAGEVGAMVGAAAGKKVGQLIAPGDLTRSQLIERSMKIRATDGKVLELGTSGAQPSNPPAFPLPPEIVPPANPRENTQLHSDIATHYGEQMGETPYNELEDRFLSDVQIKKKFKVPLDPSERKLLQGINEAKVEEVLKARGESEAQLKAAEKAKAEADKVAAEAEKEKQEKLDLGMPVSTGPPFEVAESELKIPKKFAELGYTPQRIRAHEAGHVVMLHDAGFSPQEVISHLHKDAEGNLASARWNDEEFRDEDGHPDIEKIKDKLPEILAAIHGGPVAEEMLHGAPVHSNPGAAGDFKLAKQVMDLANVPAAERGAIMKTAELRAREVLTKPGVIDTIKRHTEFRKAGLDEDTHMDPETVGAMTQEIKNLGGTNGNDNNPTAGKTGGLGKESKPGGEGGVSGKAKEAARPAGKTRESAGSPEGKGKLDIGQGGHAGGEVASVEELARPGRFVKISRSGMPTDQGKTPDFNLGVGEAGYQVKPDGTYELKAGQETPVTKRGVEGYSNALKMNIKGPETPSITEIIPELKDHPEIEQKIKDLGFEKVLQKEYTRQHQASKPEPILETKVKSGVVEKSTGSAEDDAAIKAGGGIPGGVMDFGEFGKIRMFHDPETGTTLGIKGSETITPEVIKAKLGESKKQFGLKNEKAIPKSEPNIADLKMNLAMDPEQFKSWFGKSKIVDADGKPTTAYHGTTSPIDFDEFSTEGAPTDNEGNAIVGASGDPNAYLGAHFAIGENAAQVANKFAVNKEGWMRSRYEGENPKPRVIPTHLKIENPAKFKSETDLNHFINRTGKISNDDLLAEAVLADDIDPYEDNQKLEGWYDKYDKDPNFRAEQNDWILKHAGRHGYEESNPVEEAAAELGQQAKAELRKKGHDGIIYRNDVEGGHAAVAFDPEQIQSAIQNKGTVEKLFPKK